MRKGDGIGRAGQVTSKHKNIHLWSFVLSYTSMVYIFGYYSIFNLKRKGKKPHLLMLPNSQKWFFEKFNMFSVVCFPFAQHRDDEMDHVSKNSKWGGCGEATESKQRQQWEVPLWQGTPRHRAGARMETLGLRLLHRKINWGTKINTHISMLDSRRARRCQTFGFLVWLDYFLLSQSKLLYFLSSLFYVRSSVQMGKKWKPEQKHKGWMLHLLSTGMFQIIVILKGPQCLRNISSLNVAPFFFFFFFFCYC